MKTNYSVKNKIHNNARVHEKSTPLADYVFHDDFANGLENWSIASGDPVIVESTGEYFVEIKQGDVLRSKKLDNLFKNTGFFRFSFKMKKAEQSNKGNFSIYLPGFELEIILDKKTTDTISYERIICIPEITADTHFIAIELSSSDGTVYFGDVSIEEVEATRIELFDGDLINEDWVANPNFTYKIGNDTTGRFLEITSDYEVKPYVPNGLSNLLTLKELFGSYDPTVGAYGVSLYAEVSLESSDIEISAFGRKDEASYYFSPFASWVSSKGLQHNLHIDSGMTLIENTQDNNDLIEYGIGVCTDDDITSPLKTIYIRNIYIYKGIVEKEVTLSSQ
ncbi:hypothetical protein [Enterobacter asburiae]|uniref:hypothetical protein n=1 Tax=Enterobacter asburiae TaxID=61645 RepID=UPI0011D25432|nr:hypothetical protein [Enterobacter asburiae]